MNMGWMEHTNTTQTSMTHTVALWVTTWHIFLDLQNAHCQISKISYISACMITFVGSKSPLQTVRLLSHKLKQLTAFRKP